MDAVVIPTQVPVLYYVQYVLYLLDHQYLSSTAAPSSSSSITHSVFQQPHKSSSLLLAASFSALLI
jgi:hypothetical protein